MTARIQLRHATIAGLSVLAAPALAQTAAPPGKTLAFLNAPAGDAPLTDVPRLAVGVGDRVRPAVVDTGSTGVVLSASAIPTLAQLPFLGPGTITYSSSGRVMIGRWVVTALTIAGRTGRIVTRPLPVLAVDRIACTPSARRCTPEERPAHVAMLGIGFGRAHDHQPGGTPDRNPLLNVAEPAGLARSYVITRQGIRLGASATGFNTTRLVRDAADADWQAPAACVTLGDGTPSCGSVLVDTGITGMFLTMPADQLPAGGGQALPDGTRITIDLAPGSRAMGYTVQIGDARDDAAPSSVTLAGIGKRPTFVNTGARLLNRFDYLFDADVGLVGYRAAQR